MQKAVNSLQMKCRSRGSLSVFKGILLGCAEPIVSRYFQILYDHDLSKYEIHVTQNVLATNTCSPFAIRAPRSH